jgi:hypothetical protein
LWAAGDSGIQVRRDGTWASVSAAISGTSFEQVLPLDDGSVLAAAGDGGLMAFHPDGAAWRLETISGLPLPNVHSVAATSDGTIWVGSGGSWGGHDGGLAHFDGRMWQQDYPLDGSLPVGGYVRIQDLLTASDGSLWAAGAAWASDETLTKTFTARFAAGRWTVYDAAVASAWSLAELPDGSIVMAGDGVSTITDGRRTRELAGQWFQRLSVAPDGAVWVVGQDVYRIR